jgi:hypothetical protein
MDASFRWRACGLRNLSGADCVWHGDRAWHCLLLSDLEGYLTGAHNGLRTVSASGSSCEFWGRGLRGGAASGTLGPFCAQRCGRVPDGSYGIVAWALAVVITGVVAVASVVSLSSKTAPPATSSATTAGEPLIAYELDRLFRGDRRAVEGDITYARAEAGRILLAATGRRGITPDDKAYLARLVAARTGIALPDAERRVEDAITAASTAVQKARRSAVILGFATAASLLAGAAAAWYAACAGGRHRDNVAPPLTWRWPQRA